MRRAVSAIFCHLRSSDEKPAHQLCSESPNTWCKYNLAKHEGTLSSFKHTKSLPIPVSEAISPNYKSLFYPVPQNGIAEESQRTNTTTTITSFNPSNEDSMANVHVFTDAPHTLQLIRNWLDFY